ncbi:unnamed protein product [Ectocarpus sp. 4 AP-2014]
MPIPIYPFHVREGSERQEDVKNVAKSVMKDAWLNYPTEDIVVTTIGGGITNLLFKLQGPPAEAAILVRIFGKDTDVLIDRERDNALFDELASINYAPPFHGRFSNGRIEGFLPARALEPQELSNRSPVDFVSLIAREMGRLHGLQVVNAGPPGEAEIWQVLPKWLQLAKGLTFEDESKAAAIKALDLDWICEEVEWLRQKLCREPDGADNGASATSVSSAAEKRANRFLSEVVLCHNDLLSGNVLHANGWDRVQVIDFEYSGYNPRAFDIANHFCEHAGFDSNFEKSYPTTDTQAAFLTAYVRAVATPESGTDMLGEADETAEEGSTDASTESPRSDEDSFVEALRTEVNRWALPSHLWWSLWAVVQARYSPIEFDFVDYARLRLAGYRLHKEAFFGIKGEKPAEDFFEFRGQKPS